MSTTSTEAAFAAVRAAQPSALSRDGCTELLREVRRLRSWLSSVEMATTRRVRELSASGQSEPPESLIPGASGCSGADAKNLGDRTDLCDEEPSLEDALADGDLTAAHLDAISAAARDLPDGVRRAFLDHSESLLARAKRISLESFRRECRRLAKRLLAASRKGSDADELDAQKRASKLDRWVDRVDGMHHTHLALDPERDAKLSKAWNAELARLQAIAGNSDVPWQQLKVDAFVNAIAGIRTPAKGDDEFDVSTGRADTPASEASSTSVIGDTATSGCSCSGHGGDPRRRTVDRVPDVSLVVSYDWLVGHAAAGGCETVDGVPLPISTVRRLCCDAEVVPTVLGTSGEVLDQGRSARTATGPQRKALRSMHRGCAFPGCGVGFDACRIHHVVWWWAQRGRTDLANLLPVCERHHHLVREGGWVLTMEHDPARTATWRRPDGTVHHRGTTIDRQPASRAA